ncbi:hypothetical protein TCAL_16611 [Tigriopus californicus]|uniref:Uncharacterized protein n=1 Tax=Tigriopus californicus TaxID=6832 RepID=A0A553NAR4_TIGCA|nr:hypothetical protein TCAL_16611 [Tigriopus californicus]
MDSSESSGSISLFQLSFGLLQLILDSVSSSLRDDQVLTGLITGSLLVFELTLGLLDLLLVLLDGSMGFGIGSVSVFQGNVKLIDIGFKFLLHSLAFGLGSGFSLEGLLHAVQGLLAFSDLVNLVDVPTPFADLIHDVLDLATKGSIFLSHSFQVLLVLLIGSLDLEQVRGVGSTFHLNPVQFPLKGIDLGLPFGDNAVKVSGLLFHLMAPLAGLIHIGRHILDLALKASLLLFKIDRLGVQGFYHSLGFSQPRLQLHLGGLELFSTGKTFFFVFLAPIIDISIGLCQLTSAIIFGLVFLFHLLPDQIHFMFEISEFSKSVTCSWATFRSPSTFLLALSVSNRAFFSRSKESSISSRVCSSLALILFKCSNFSSDMLVNNFILGSDLIVHASNGVIFVGLLLLSSLKFQFHVFNVFFEASQVALESTFLVIDSSSFSLRISQTLLSSLERGFQLGPLSTDFGQILLIGTQVTLGLGNIVQHGGLFTL